MPLKTSQTVEDPHINLTPMVDVVFLLIIFFMVGTQLTPQTLHERQFNVHLPIVSSAQPLTRLPDEIVVNVLADGTIVVNDQDRDLKQLETDLKAAKQNYADQSVMLRGEGTGPYQRVMDVLAVCHRAKIGNISLANQLKRGDSR